LYNIDVLAIDRLQFMIVQVNLNVAL
jgi:hypothetical protein